MTEPHASSERIAWFHCFAGIAGDMVLGSLIDAGADADELRRMLSRLPLSGWGLRTEPALRGGISCTRAVVSTEEDKVRRTHADVAELVRAARLPPRVEARSLAIFSRLAEVEGRIHDEPPELVHFHEVGSHDAIVDVVGSACALELLQVDEVRSSPIATGMGTVSAAHGVLPVPAPAVIKLLEGAPVYGRDLGSELTTPTGAAIIAATASGFGPLPPMQIAASGFGAGSRDLDDLPNCTQVVVGLADMVAGGEPSGQPVVLLEANLDDATGEQLAYALALLLDAGAHDAWVTPIVMKKGRPAHCVHVLSDISLVDPLKRLITETTGTFGVRAVSAQRWPAPRSVEVVTVDGHNVRMKHRPGRVKPEFDDVADVAKRTGLGLSEVAFRAEQAWHDARRPRDERTAPGSTEDP
ncbi:MAG: nickel pincer cofactor biosynthesis protein LarC [Acidimicrobiales bacterium]